MTSVLTAFVINKVVAIYAGPTGLALIGQLTSISNGAITQGIVKYTAEYRRKTKSLVCAKIGNT